MTNDATAVLPAWTGFYATAGASAAALTGLMFVVVTLVASVQRFRPNREGIAAFSTPTVLHFSTALLVSIVVDAPWKSLVAVSVVVGIVGLYGIVHVASIALRSRRVGEYDPDIDDLIWYAVVPLIAYAIMFGGAVALTRTPHVALFAVAASVSLLIFVGIRNAWDVVTFIALQTTDEPEAPAEEKPDAARRSIRSAGGR